jgi:hypothetical protein
MPSVCASGSVASRTLPAAVARGNDLAPRVVIALQPARPARRHRQPRAGRPGKPLRGVGEKLEQIETPPGRADHGSMFAFERRRGRDGTAFASLLQPGEPRRAAKPIVGVAPTGRRT